MARQRRARRARSLAEGGPAGDGVALVLGSLAAFGLAGARFFGRDSISFLFVLPIALPGIITGLALNSFFVFWAIELLALDDRRRSCHVLRGRRLQQRGGPPAAHVGLVLRGLRRPRRDGFQTFRAVTLPSSAPRSSPGRCSRSRSRWTRSWSPTSPRGPRTRCRFSLRLHPPGSEAADRERDRARGDPRQPHSCRARAAADERPREIGSRDATRRRRVRGSSAEERRRDHALHRLTFSARRPSTRGPSRSAATYEDANSVVFGFENPGRGTCPGVCEAPGLIAPGTVARAVTPGHASSSTIWVEDTDAACAVLAARGVELLNGPIDRAWGMRTASFTDPDGHIWELAASDPRQAGQRERTSRTGIPSQPSRQARRQSATPISPVQSDARGAASSPPARARASRMPGLVTSHFCRRPCGHGARGRRSRCPQCRGRHPAPPCPRGPARQVSSARRLEQARPGASCRGNRGQARDDALGAPWHHCTRVGNCSAQ